jgi:hypothetical protein
VIRFWGSVAVGTAIAGWGAYLFVEAVPDLDRRGQLLAWIVGADLAHDLVIAPLLLLVGWLCTRWVPPTVRAPVQAGLIASAAVLAVGWLPLMRSADHAGNATIQPLDYTTAVATALAIVWIGAAAWAATRWRRAGRPT